MTNGGDVLNEGIVLDGEVVGGDGLAQTLATLEEFEVKVVTAIVLAHLLSTSRNIVEPSSELLHNQEDVPMRSGSGCRNRGVIAANNLAFANLGARDVDDKPVETVPVVGVDHDQRVQQVA